MEMLAFMSTGIFSLCTKIKTDSHYGNVKWARCAHFYQVSIDLWCLQNSKILRVPLMAFKRGGKKIACFLSFEGAEIWVSFNIGLLCTVDIIFGFLQDRINRPIGRFIF